MRINLRAALWALAILIPALVACGEAIAPTPTGSSSANVAVIEPAFGSQLASGQQLFGTYCAGCHGKNGEGQGPFPPVNSALHAYKHPDWELIALIKEGKNGMPGFGQQLNDDQIVDIIARVKAWWGPGQLSEQRELCLLYPGPTPTPQ